MVKTKYLILGAGPAGLTFANRLLDLDETDFVVLEQENEAGGLCRSKEVDGSPLDIGGGHFLDVRRPNVCEYLFRFLPKDEWNYYERDSRINLGYCEVSHPLEANIWQMPKDKQREFLDSIGKAGCNSDSPMPSRFVDWIYWKLGEKIAEDYMLPYNRKMFSDELDELGTYWLEKLPNVSYEETLKSCEDGKAYGTQPGHAQFLYPKKYGYGEVWLRMAARLGNRIRYNEKVVHLDADKKTVASANGDVFQADVIITTIPWTSFCKITGFSDETASLIGNLKSSSVEIRYCSDNLNTEAQWIYEPNPDKPYHRILVRHNFCENSRGYWLETRKERISLYAHTEYQDCEAYLNEYAYPLNTLDKPQIMHKILNDAKAQGIVALGRWGEHNHYNSDLVVDKALNLAEALVK